MEHIIMWLERMAQMAGEVVLVVGRRGTEFSLARVSRAMHPDAMPS
jgi:hypothetical protein